MEYNDLSEMLRYNNKEAKLFVPNEIFDDLKTNIKSASHIAFAYSYIYLITWLYRYTKYGHLEVVMNNKNIKKLLGYNPNNQTLDYLIKRNGLLDIIGYTESTRNYPIGWEYSSLDDELSFFTIDDMEDFEKIHVKQYDKRFFLKRPIKSFERNVLDGDEEVVVDGSFFDVSYTHNIPFDIFLFCMSTKNLGVLEFYLYSYLKHKNDIFTGGYDVPLPKLAKDTGLSLRTVNNCLSQLKKYRMIDCIHNMEFFVLDISKEERLANTYKTRESHSFSQEEVSYKKIGFKTLESYNKHLESNEELTQDINNNMPSQL